MINDKLILVIARESGTKYVSKQNLRLVGGKPLLYYVLQTVSTSLNCHVVVSTDSEEIKEYAKFFGVSVIDRPKKLAKDNTKLEEIAIDALEKLKKHNLQFKKCLIIHPHFPLIKKETIKRFFSKINNEISVVYGYEKESELDDSFAVRRRKDNLIRLNEKIVKIKKIVSFDCQKLVENKNFGKCIYGLSISRDEIFSPTSYRDFFSLESIITRKRILVRVDGEENIGLGHVYNMLTVLNNIRNEDILILMNKNRDLGSKKFNEHLYNVRTFSNNEELWKIIDEFDPHIVFNDILNTSFTYIRKLKKRGIFVVNFEDLGEGRKLADLVFNPIFQTAKKMSNEYYGSQYACVREEFRVFKRKNLREKVEKIVLTLGGVDKSNNTLKILSIIQKYALLRDVKITVILGLGFIHKSEIHNKIKKMRERGHDIDVVEKSEFLSKYLIDCDFAITSNGRTVFEVASLQIPMISLSVNKREQQHNFVQKYDVGYDVDLTKNDCELRFVASVKKMLKTNIRQMKIKNLEKIDLKKGIYRVTTKIMSEFESVKLVHT
jgi:spore coat polysaccharide biosynthesis predicted glycosyltransferase SpsG